LYENETHALDAQHREMQSERPAATPSGTDEKSASQRANDGGSNTELHSIGSGKTTATCRSNNNNNNNNNPCERKGNTEGNIIGTANGEIGRAEDGKP
jgi:hypothetical protein